MLDIAIGALGGVAAAAGLSWASMDARTQLYGRTFTGTRGRGRRIALTYDDGPNDPCTLRLLEVLARHDVRATFFMIGAYVVERPEIARAVVAAGHEVGNHTYAHPNLIWCSAAELKHELELTTLALHNEVGAHTKFFRPPFGGKRPATLRGVRQLGLVPVMWSVSARDWALPSASAIEQQVVSRLRGGDVVLMHDGSHRAFGFDRSKTVAATDAIIRRAKDAGYEFCTVGEMIAESGNRVARV